jgi:hypothetical protein
MPVAEYLESLEGAFRPLYARRIGGRLLAARVAFDALGGRELHESFAGREASRYLRWRRVNRAVATVMAMADVGLHVALGLVLSRGCSDGAIAVALAMLGHAPARGRDLLDELDRGEGSVCDEA